MQRWMLAIATFAVLLTGCGAEAAVEEEAPDFTLQAADGQSVTLSDLRGDPVLLFFHMADG